jgi:hypothetical protein
MLFGLLGKSENTSPSFFSISDGTKIVLGIFGVAAVFFSVGYALRPVEEIFDDLHDSDTESDDSPAKTEMLF